MPPARIPTLTAPHRVRHRIHRCSPHMRPSAHPAFSSRFSQHNAAVFRIPDLPDRCPALARQTADLTGRQCNLRPFPFASVDDSRATGRAAQLPALARLHLDIVNRHPRRNLLQRHAIADLRFYVRAADDRVARFQSQRSDDVPLLAIHIVQKGNPCRTAGIVFDPIHLGRNGILVALKIDNPIQPFVATSAMTGCDLSLVVAAALLLGAYSQGLFGPLLAIGQFGKVTDRSTAAPRRSRFVLSSSHEIYSRFR